MVVIVCCNGPVPAACDQLKDKFCLAPGLGQEQIAPPAAHLIVDHP